MGAFILAWLTGEAIIVYRSVKVQGGPPWPGQLLAGTGAFAALALLSEAGPGARQLALTAAWGLNAAGFLALFPASPAALGNGMGSLTGTNPSNNGWWANVTANRVSDSSVLPAAGGCGPASSGGGTGSVPDASGNCPPGYIPHNGKCVPPMVA